MPAFLLQVSTSCQFSRFSIHNNGNSSLKGFKFTYLYLDRVVGGDNGVLIKCDGEWLLLESTDLSVLECPLSEVSSPITFVVNR